MAFDWNQYQPETGGITGQPSVDPSQLQVQPAGVSLQTPAPTSPMNPGNGGVAYNPYSDPNYSGPPLPSSPFIPAGGATTMPMTPPPPSPFTGVGGAQSGQPWDQNYFTQNFGTPRTPQELVALESKITAAGGKVLRNASGVAGKIQTPDGRIIDVINSAGAGGNGFQWLDGGGGSASGSGTLGNLGFGSGAFVSPIGQFTPPTAEDALNSPGLQFALSEANRMGQNSAAAKGTLLNGRFQQALGASNIQNALGGYGDVFNRSLQTFGTNFGVQTRNQDAPYQKFLSLAQLGQGAAAAS